MNFRFIAADVISKSIIVVSIAAWAKFAAKGSYEWSITSFSLAGLVNSLVVGVPLMNAMFGPVGKNLVIQSSILQFTVWNVILLVMYAFRSVNKAADIEGNGGVEEDLAGRRKPSVWILIKIVGVKIGKNPNSYACILGLAWALVSYRWDVKMPNIIEGSVLIMAKAGSGIGMFCIGLFMALQPKIIDCGAMLTSFAMVLRFGVAPATMAVGSLIVGLRGNVLCMAIIQAAIPQSISSFVFAKEYDLYTNVFSTAVIFGTIVSIPVLITYFVVLDVLIL